MLLTLVARAAIPLLLIAGVRSPQEAPPPDPVATGAWMKILGLAGGGSAPVSLSEAEVNALLGSPQIEAALVGPAGLSGLVLRLLAGEVRLGGELEPTVVSEMLGPLAPPPPAGRGQPFEVSVRLRGAGGMGEAQLLRGAVAGLEVPPQLLAGALESFLAAMSGGSQSPGGARFRLGAPFPLPGRLEALEVRSGELLLTPAAR